MNRDLLDAYVQPVVPDFGGIAAHIYHYWKQEPGMYAPKGMHNIFAWRQKVQFHMQEQVMVSASLHPHHECSI